MEESDEEDHQTPHRGLWPAFCCPVVFSAPLCTDRRGRIDAHFTEPEKGSTFNFVDAPPNAVFKHGFPTSFSPGDELVLTNPLKQGAKTIGKLRPPAQRRPAPRATDPADS